jgi:hypothetical protein
LAFNFKAIADELSNVKLLKGWPEGQLICCNPVPLKLIVAFPWSKSAINALFIKSPLILIVPSEVALLPSLKSTLPPVAIVSEPLITTLVDAFSFLNMAFPAPIPVPVTIKSLQLN